MNGPQMNNPAALNRILKAGNTPAQNIEQLYLVTLSRHPSAKELTRLTAYVNNHKDAPNKAYADVLWALINSSAFTLNH